MNSMRKLTFSIVIPTYKTDVVLMQCLDALSHQSVDRKFFEVIVVNDGGKSDIYEKLSCLKDKLTLKYFYQENKGPAAARNIGLKHAKGNIILFLDDDSLPPKDWLKTVMKAWENFPDFDGIGGYTISEFTDSIYCRVNSDFFNWYLEQHANDKLHPFLVTCNSGYKKGILDRVGNFDESYKKPSGEDRDLNIKISKIDGKLRLDKNIVVYHDRDLTFYSFVKKHYNYGKAACLIYARYPELKFLTSDSYIALYRSILKKYRSLREKFMAFLLLTLSQLATITGYYIAILLEPEPRH